MSALSGKIQKAPPGVLGFDTDVALSFAKAKQFKESGYVFCLRYISRKDDEEANGEDLTRSEAENILNAGLGLMAVQHVSGRGWKATSDLGTTYGKAAQSNAIIAGLPPGINIWLDLEGEEPISDSSSNIVEYCNNWFKEVSEAGYIPGVYVGANAGLNSEQLHNLHFQHYWKSVSHVPDVTVRGYQMIQTRYDKIVHGINIDENTTQNDHQDGQALWLI